MTARPPVLAAQAVTVRRAGRAIVDAVSLALPAGQVTGLIGPNGAGKTTLLRVLAGLTAPDTGAVTLDGRPLAAWSARERARRLALVPAQAEVAFAWTALELVLMGRAPHLALGRLEAAADHQAARDALARVDALALADRPFEALSAGEQQRVMVARALAQAPQALLLDEPTSHLDPAHALRLSALLRELAAQGHAVAVVFHDLNLAARACDALALMVDGRLVAAGPPDQVLTPARLSAAYGAECRRVEGPFVSILWEP